MKKPPFSYSYDSYLQAQQAQRRAGNPTMLWITAFLVTWLLLTGFLAFLLVDWNTRQAAFPQQAGLFLLQLRDGALQLSIAGKQLSLPQNFFTQGIAFLDTIRAFLPLPLRIPTGSLCWLSSLRILLGY